MRRSSGRIEYQMQLVDSLVYAALALKDGPISIERALQAASNKIAATVNRKCSNLLLFKKLETPFPKGKAR